jgi:hypothetical protein
MVAVSERLALQVSVEQGVVAVGERPCLAGFC